MKNVGLFGILIIGFLVVTGCGTKALICDSSGNDVGRKIETHIEVHFKDKKASTVTETIDMEFEDPYKETVGTIYKTLVDQYKHYKKEDGIVVRVSKTKDSIKVKLNIDVKTQERATTGENVVDVTASREEIKKSLKDSGYTCKK